MPSAYCVRCGATYDSPKISANGPVCRYCLQRGDVVVMLAAWRGRFALSPIDRRPVPREQQPTRGAPAPRR